MAALNGVDAPLLSNPLWPKAPPLPCLQASGREAGDRTMNPLPIDPPRRQRLSGLLLALAVGLALMPGPALAVGGDGIFYSRDSADDGAYYSNQASFRIPFGDVDRRIQEVILYVSTDFGRTYQKVTTAGPNDKEFRFESKRDAWYWFTVQTRDADGRFAPPDLSLAQPQIKVCVDTHAPVVTLRWLQAPNGQAGVEWDASDANLDLSTLRVDYRAVGGPDWIPLPIKQASSGQYTWNTGTNAALEARITVQDKAHNPAEYKTAPSNSGFKTGVGVAPGPGPTAPPTQPTPAPDGPSGVIMVNTKSIRLDFKIDDVGSSKVKAVEVWYTQDGRTWQKTPQDAGPEPPYTVEVPAEGRYGFTLIARSGVGLGLPAPKNGDTPQVWVEVDETKPKVSIVGVEVGRGPDTGYITVRWTATDKHMAANPITISYVDAATGPSGQWQTMTPTNITNDGHFVWRMPADLPPQILVRVEAIDQAGNVGVDDTTKPVSTDLSIPKARVTDVHPAKPAGARHNAAAMTNQRIV